jgi:hypothetical protein
LDGAGVGSYPSVTIGGVEDCGGTTGAETTGGAGVVTVELDAGAEPGGAGAHFVCSRIT